MKKKVYGLGLLLVTALVFVMASCSKDDKNGPNGGEHDGTLYGEWVSSSGTYYKKYLSFDSDGTGTEGQWDVDCEWVNDEDDITWFTVNDEMLYINGRGYPYWCDGSELEIEWPSGTVRYYPLD